MTQLRAASVLQSLLVIGLLISGYAALLEGDLRYVAVTLAFAALVAAARLPARMWAKQVVFTGVLLIAVNFATTPFVREAAPTLTRNFSETVRIVGDAMPGFTGIQRISTDSRGYRTNRPIDYASKPAGVFRIFAIGGSTTEQIALGDEETWVSIVGSTLEKATGRRVEAVNTGVSGLRAVHHVATLQRIAAYQPDLVLIMMGVNDWNRHIRTRGNAYVEFFFDVTDRLDLRESVMAKAFRRILEVALRDARKARTGAVRDEDGSYFSKQNDSLERQERREFFPVDISSDYARRALELADLCRSRTFNCLFVDQPHAYRADIPGELRRRLWMTPPDEPYTLTLENMAHIANLYNARLREIAAQRRVPLCAISTELPASTDVFYDDCHFNEAGARRVAELLARCITGQKLLH